MKEIFIVEEYNEAVKKYNEKIKIDFYSNINNYTSYDGYADLRNYSLSEENFKMLWRFQDLLFTFDYLDTVNNSNIYNEIKTLYSNIFKGEIVHE